MKYKGEVIKGPNVEVVVIPRPPKINEKGEQEPNDLILQIGAVLDYTEFDALFPEPLPPMAMVPGGATTVDTENKDYRAQRNAWGQKRIEWTVLKSLAFTPELEWERVKMDDPETWNLYREEFKDAGLTPAQVIYLINRVFTVNGIDETRMEEARRRFFASRQQAQGKS